MSSPFASSLNVPTTQNTAPVIKFRCLFTHDMRRKAKRWQDGYLRFHTFNKRAMVYDTTGNFVGDLHWRHDESIQDGDELELDRGVMIQVCEPMEKTETDLSTLYAKKSSQGSPSRPADSPTPSVRSSAPLRSSLSSQPSRSLNDLLGIKKTPIGHLVSPYADRSLPGTDKVVQQVSQRAPKRQKTTSSNSHPHASLPNHPRQVPTHPVVIDLSEPVEPVEQSQTAQLGRRRMEKSREGPNLSKARSDSLSTSSTKSTNTTDNPRPDNPRSVAGDVSKASSRVPTDRPMNKLRLSNEKPRKKLMYSALLPNQASSKVATTTAALSERTNRPAQDKPQNASTINPDRMPTNPDFTPSASTQFVLDEMIDDSVQSPAMAPSKPVNSRPSPLLSAAVRQNVQAQGLPQSRSLTGLRKSYSDPTTLASANGFQNRTACSKSPLNGCNNDDTNLEQGPWTTEALDLFDFWPPGRPKPG